MGHIPRMMKTYHFTDLVDITSLQIIAEANYRANGVPIGIVDALDGSVVVAAGWHDLCVKFHRAVPASAERCRESNAYIAAHPAKGQPCHYKCRNGLWEIGVPILVGGQHLATLFIGQFFYEGEELDRAFFENQAAEFGFHVPSYLAALDRVPVQSREKVQVITEYTVGLAAFLAESAGKVLWTYQTEDALRRSEDRYRRLYESMTDAFCSVDMVGRILEANPAFQDMLGYSLSELQRLTYMDFTPSRWHAGEARIVAEQIRARGYSDVYEKEYIRKDGLVFPVELRTFLLRGDDGQPVAMWAIVRDITERQRAEMSLRESEDRFKTIFQSVNDAVYIHELPSGRLLDVNLRVCEMFGYTHAEALQVKVGDTSSNIPPYTQADADAWIQKALKDGPQVFDWHARHKDGHLFWLEVSLRLARIGNTDCLVATGRDVTKRKRLEQQLLQSQKMEAVGNLAGGIAHDFNNILHAIISSAQLIKLKFSGPENLHKIANDILALSERAADLTRGMLAFSRKQVLLISVLELNELVRSSLKLYSRIIGEDVDLRLDLSEEPFMVNLDAAQIQQVLLNLTTNARDAMKTGGTLTVSSSREQRTLPDAVDNPVAKQCAVLTFHDTGAGMTEDVLPHIFEPFFTTKDVGKGTGLGLSVVYGIVQQHGGVIDVRSTPGQGTTISIALPLSDMRPEGRRVYPPESAFGSGEVLLLVEDDPEVRRATATILEAYGYSVRSAANGPEALAIHKESPRKIQVALIDVIMPGMSGEQVCDALLAVQPDLKVIFLNGYPKDVLEQRQLREIMCIPKPVIPSDLMRTIRTALDS